MLERLNDVMTSNCGCNWDFTSFDTITIKRSDRDDHTYYISKYANTDHCYIVEFDKNDFMIVSIGTRHLAIWYDNMELYTEDDSEVWQFLALPNSDIIGCSSYAESVIETRKELVFREFFKNSDVKHKFFCIWDNLMSWSHQPDEISLADMLAYYIETK